MRVIYIYNMYVVFICIFDELGQITFLNSESTSYITEPTEEIESSLRPIRRSITRCASKIKIMYCTVPGK